MPIRMLRNEEPDIHVLEMKIGNYAIVSNMCQYHGNLIVRVSKDSFFDLTDQKFGRFSIHDALQVRELGPGEEVKIAVFNK